ncbi:MAG: hypothetical protein LBG44_11930 [Gemmatimonadota bacterium]|jgi:hypothetical protein|nr:hypothetical protein [Gemmatimonadota bacterium]
MMTRFALAVAALLIAAPLSAQAPANLHLRVDKSTSASDPDDTPDVVVTSEQGGTLIKTGPAVVAWNTANTASGTYTLSGTFTLQAASDHVNYYGLVFGGSQLEGGQQSYLYFLVAQDGSFLVKHRMNDEMTHDVIGRTPEAAVRKFEGTPSVNALQVRVGAQSTEFVVNGTVVHTMPRVPGLSTDGIWGVRVNHRLPGVLVTDLRVTE